MIAPARIHDVLYVCRRMDPTERAEQVAVRGEGFDPDEFAMQLYHLGTCHAALGPDGLPRYVGGLVPLHPGVMGTWMVHTADWRPCVREVIDTCTRALETTLANGTHRVELRAIATNHRAHAFYRRLGFHEEARLRAYGMHGEDFLVFARLREEI